MSETQWKWWRQALEGNFGPVHENEPQSGYYRLWDRQRQAWKAIAIWRDGDDLLALSDGETADPLALWTWVCRAPISYDLYEAVTERGEAWPDLPPPKEHNLGLTEIETLTNEFVGERSEIIAAFKGGITTQEAADRASNWVGRIADIAKRAEALRKAEKQPFDEAAAAVQAKWKPLIEDVDALVKRMKAAINEFLVAEQARRAKEAAAAAEAGGAVRPIQNARAGTVGRKVALRTVKRVRITDIKAVAAFFASMESPPPDLTDVLKILATRVIRAGVAVPGVVEEETQVAA